MAPTYVELEPDLFRRCNEGDEDACRELVEGFWDRQIMRAYFDHIRLREPTPTPMRPRDRAADSLAERIEILEANIEMHEVLLADVIRDGSFDTDLQSPLFRNITDTEIQLDVAQKVHGQLSELLDEIESDIENLENRRDK